MKKYLDDLFSNHYGSDYLTKAHLNKKVNEIEDILRIQIRNMKPEKIE